MATPLSPARISPPIVSPLFVAQTALPQTPVASAEPPVVSGENNYIGFDQASPTAALLNPLQQPGSFARPFTAKTTTTNYFPSLVVDSTPLTNRFLPAVHAPAVASATDAILAPQTSAAVFLDAPTAVLAQYTPEPIIPIVTGPADPMANNPTFKNSPTVSSTSVLPATQTVAAPVKIQTTTAPVAVQTPAAKNTFAPAVGKQEDVAAIQLTVNTTVDRANNNAAFASATTNQQLFVAAQVLETALKAAVTQGTVSPNDVATIERDLLVVIATTLRDAKVSFASDQELRQFVTDLAAVVVADVNQTTNTANATEIAQIVGGLLQQTGRAPNQAALTKAITEILTARPHLTAEHFILSFYPPAFDSLVAQGFVDLRAAQGLRMLWAEFSSEESTNLKVEATTAASNAGSNSGNSGGGQQAA